MGDRIVIAEGVVVELPEHFTPEQRERAWRGHPDYLPGEKDPPRLPALTAEEWEPPAAPANDTEKEQ